MIAPLVTTSILAASILAASNLAASNLPASAQGPATTVAAEERPARERTELDGIVADARVGESTSEVGLPITYTVLIEGAGAESMRVDRLERLGAFDVLEVRTAPGNGPGRTIEVVLSTFDSGELRPDPLPIRWQLDGREERGSIVLPAVTIASIIGDEVDPASYRDIKGEVPIEVPTDPMPWILGSVLLALAGAGAWWLLRRPARPIAPDAWALGELARLDRDGPHTRGEYGRFYDALTTIVRGYAARRYAIPADRQTSREFLDAARARGGFPETEIEHLRALLRLADLVKFAAMEPSRGECDAHLAEARGFVERTRPTPAAGEASAAGGEE